MDHDEQLMNRYRELLDRASSTGVYMYTDFHSPAGAALVYRISDDSCVKLWGGREDCERVLIRFGDPADIGYEESFPISVIHIVPRQPKYADHLTHRDFLGAVMNLGIERDVIGDIYVKDNEAYVFVCARMADYVAEGITQVRHTPVKCRIIDEIPGEAAPKLKTESVTVSSLRADGILAKVFHLSRNDSKDLFSSEKVFINGRLCINPSCEPKEGDNISVRGHGKMIYDGIIRKTSKDRYAVSVRVYTD